MTATPDLYELYTRTSRDERGFFIEGPETEAFFAALAAAPRLTPPQLLDLAQRLRKDPGRTQLADAAAFQALSAIAHDPTCLKILSKVSAEMTPWGVTFEELFRKTVDAHRGKSHVMPRYSGPPGTLGTGGSSGTMAFSGMGCRQGCTHNGHTWAPFKCTYTQLNAQAMAYLNLPWRYIATCCIDGNLCSTLIA